MKKKGIYLLIMLLLLTLTACGNSSADEGEIYIYYTNASNTRLLSEVYVPQAEGMEEKIREIYARMQSPDYGESLSAIPSTLTLETVRFSGTLLTLYLEGETSTLSSASQVLFLAALTRTMTQFDEVDGVYLYLNKEAATDEQAKVVGILRISSYVDNAADNAEDYRETELTLYFANSGMDALVQVKRTVSYRSSTALERVVVEQLLAGPEKGENVNATLPSTATLLSIHVRDGICYVNFDDKLITDVMGGYDYIPVYSLVNSLTELSGIEQVQISINGSTEISFSRDINSFSTPFVKNLDVVE